MSEEQQQENGSSGEVPEIELIIKVSLRLFSSAEISQFRLPSYFLNRFWCFEKICDGNLFSAFGFLDLSSHIGDLKVKLKAFRLISTDYWVGDVELSWVMYSLLSHDSSSHKQEQTEVFTKHSLSSDRLAFGRWKNVFNSRLKHMQIKIRQFRIFNFLMNYVIWKKKAMSMYRGQSSKHVYI